MRIRILLALWFVVNSVESFWIWWDESIPGWDESNHLKASLYYLQAFQEGRWYEVWQISSKYPPLTYILAALSQGIFGLGNDSALLMNWGLNAIILLAVYRIGQRLFNDTVAFWGGAIVLLLPRLSYFRLAFLTDITLAAFTILSFSCLTDWHFSLQRRQQWLWSLAFGGSLGLALLSKQTSLFFLFVPLLATAGYHLWHRHGERLLQLLVGLIVGLLISGPWYATNWIYAFSSYNVGIVQASINEGDPALNTWAAWTHYLVDLPYALSWIWVLLPTLGILFHCIKHAQKPLSPEAYRLPLQSSLLWLGLYLVGSYLLFSLFQNKNPRYIIPYVPGFAVLAGYGMSFWIDRWRTIAWGSLGLAIVLWWSLLFPLANQGIILGVWPRPAQHPRVYPQPEVVDTIIKTTPYLRVNLGVIPSIFDLNHNNVGYFGALRRFQVSSRELGSRPESVAQDGRSFDWLLAASQALPNDHANDSQLALGDRLATDPAFDRVQTWQLPEKSRLSLYHRRQPLVTVTPLDRTQPLDELQLQVNLPPKATIGEPLPVTYHWLGNWQTLKDGLVLLTWYKQGEPAPTDQFWIQDHQIGFGTLFSGTDAQQQTQAFQVTETTATLPPKSLSPGQYSLSAEYVNLQTGERRSLALPQSIVELDQTELDQTDSFLQSPELDWLTQLHHLAPLLNEGRTGLEKIFDQVARLNQYAPSQDYLKQTQRSLALRLQQSPDLGSPGSTDASLVQPTNTQRANWYITKALAHILKEDSSGAINTFQSLIQLTPENPYLYAYLAFVHLYDWHPGLARQALQPALTLAPNLPEVQLMDAVTRFLTGDIFRAIDQLKILKDQGLL